MRKPQAKDIADDVALAAVRATLQPHGVAILWDIEKALPSFPAKVVRAKLDGLVRRGILTGCACGCRGDFAIVGEDQAAA